MSRPIILQLLRLVRSAITPWTRGARTQQTPGPGVRASDYVVLLATAMTVLSVAHVSLAQPCGGMHDLGTLGGAESEALDVSADGSVVVGWAIFGSNAVRPFRWTAAGGMQDIGNPIGGWATGVSADGNVVVISSLSGPPISWRWTAAEGLLEIANTLGGAGVQANDISANGSVVVGWADSAAGIRLAFRWTVAGGFQTISNTFGGGSAEALGVSADGAVVVGNARNHIGLSLPFRWTASGGMQQINAAGASIRGARDVSDDGSVVVGWAGFPNISGSHAFRLAAGAGIQDLGTVGGGEVSDAIGVSGDGSVVVGHATTAAIRRAFRWTADEGIQDLGTLGGQRAQANGASADGSVVVGMAHNVAGQRRAFRWTMPCPPCPADFNEDAIANSQDFFDFITAFFALQPNADFNHDTFINSQDFFDFLAALFAGC